MVNHSRLAYKLAILLISENLKDKEDFSIETDGIPISSYQMAGRLVTKECLYFVNLNKAAAF